MAAAQSKETMFSKKLTPTDMKRFVVPTETLFSLPDFKEENSVKIPVDYDTKIWTFVCKVRQQGHPKPVFNGWRKFVTANKLNVGDTITMYKVQDEDVTSSHYSIEVQRSAVSNQDHSLPSPALSLNHEVVETELGYEQQQLTEAADTLVDDFHVTTTKLSPVKVFGTDISDEAANTKCFSVIMKDIGMGEVNFFGLDAEAMGYGFGSREGNTVTDQSVSLELELVLRQPSPCAEQMKLDLILAPPNA